MLLALPGPASAWWNNTWGLRRKVTFNNSGQALNLVSFPVLIRLDNTRVEYFRTQNAGQDIRFVDGDDATVLDHDIETWNEAGSSYVWVRIPQINASSTTDFIWMYYDNPAAADGQNAAGVWEASHRGVWHLKEDPAGAPPQMRDSTSNLNHGTIQFAPVQTPGQINGSLAFDGLSEHNVNVPNAASLQLPTNMTVSGWARTSSADAQSRLILAKWQGVGNNNYWLGKLDASVMAFGVDGGPNANCPLAFVNDGNWHHVVGVADAGGGRLRIYVDGVERGNAPYGGTSQTGTSPINIGRSPDIGLQDWVGGIDEVRVENVARSADWLRAQHLSMRDTFATFGPAACFSGCQGLTVSNGGTSLTVTSANAFELVFSDAAGGHADRFFDLDEDPGRVHDLAGGVSNQHGLFLDEIDWLVDGVNYRSDKSANGGRGAARLLETTSARVVVRSESYFWQQGGASILPGVRGYGDWSVYASGRLALNWKRVTTSAVDTTFDQLHLNLHQQVAAPLNGWAGFTQSGPICFTNCTGPAGDDFVVMTNETAGAPGARTDFLTILSTDWTGATDTFGGEQAVPEWVEDSWIRSVGVTLPADTTETWSFLTYFKPTIFTSNTDPAVTARSADYRGPDNLASPSAPAAGSGWFDAGEGTTSPSDFFNEKEAAYALNLDPVAGLTFDLDGGTTTRFHPFFKIRQWRSLTAPGTMTVEGVTVARNVDFLADLMPISRSSLHRNLLWRSTLQSLAAITGPDVGSAGSVTGGVSYEAARFGNGARVSASGDSIRVPFGANFDPARGVMGFWYRPTYDSSDGVLHDICGFFEDANNYWFFEKRGAVDGDELWFRINSGGALSTYRITAANYAWRANEWVHFTLDWDDGAALGGQQHIEINDVEPAHIDSGVDYNSTTLILGANFRFGNTDGDATFAPGVYDEIEIVRAHPLLAASGLLGDPSEFLADPAPAQNFTLNFLPVDASRRGRYLHLGATAKFRGLNVALATPGVGVPAGALEWEFWNGTGWASLEAVAGFTDTTSSFTRTGNVYWTADPPGWAPFSVFGGVDIYRIRVHLAAGSSYSTFPVEGIIKTDVLLLQYCGDVTLDAQTFSLAAPIPTAVSLQSFRASPADGAVELSWATASELQNLGFHLYRSLAADGPWTRLTSSLIPGLGSSATGASYAWRDSGLSNGTTYHYLLEDVETTGNTERHGPVSATPQQGGSGAGGGAGDGSGDSGDGSGSDGESGGSAGNGDLDSGRITWGDPTGAALRILERGPSHVVLELLTPGFTARTQSDGTVRVSIPGFEDTALPGALDVPVRRSLVEALAGRRARLASVTPEDVVSFGSFRLAAAGTRDLVVRDDGTLRTGSSPRRLLEANRRAGFTPRVWARLLGSLFQGETKKARLELSPLRHDPVTGQTVLARRLTVRVEFTGTEVSERSLGGSRGRRAPVPTLRRSGVFAQLVARDPGLYRVRFEDLFVSGQRGLPARTLRLSRRGVPVPYRLEPERSLFARGSSLFFVSEGTDPDPRGESVFEMSLGQTASFMETASGSPSGPSTTEHVHTLKLERNKFYQSSLLQAPDLWLWDLMVSPVTKSYPFTVEGLSSASSTPGRLNVVLQGASDFEELDHHLRLAVNGIPVGEATWDGMRERVVEVDLTAGVLVEGTNSLSLENVGDAGAAYSMVFLNRFDVSYPRLLASSMGRLEGRFEESGRADVSGLTGPVFVIDTTALSESSSASSSSISAPVWLRNLESTPTGLAFRAETGRRYLAVSESALLAPEVRRTVATRLRSTSTRADWVLIAPREFLPAATPLVELRRRQGLLPLAVALEDVFAEFGYGESHPQAIRDFLAFAFHNWKTRPRYAVLLGDTTYDPKNYLGTGVKDRVPSPLLQTSYLWTVSDPSLAAVNGDDLLPDLAIGRLSAGTLPEAETLVSKLVAFEEAGRTFDGTAVLVADNADLAGSFEANQDEIAATVLQGHDVEKIYVRDLGGATRATIRAAFDSGPGLVSYVGHGATAVWASENVWNNTDLATLGAQDQQPLLLTLNCLNGFFHFPPFDSLAEAFVKAEGKGALAAFSPSGLSVNDAAHLYHKALLTEIEGSQHTRLGDALLAAQKTYADQGAMPELLSIYHLFGDPALRLR